MEMDSKYVIHKFECRSLLVQTSRSTRKYNNRLDISELEKNAEWLESASLNIDSAKKEWMLKQLKEYFNEY